MFSIWIYIYISNIEFVLHDYSIFNSDNVHPNSTGTKYIHDAISQLIDSGSTSIHKDYKVVTISGSPNISNNYDVQYVLDNDMLQVYLPYQTIHFNTPIHFYGDTLIQILQLEPSNASLRGYAMGMFDDAPEIQYCIDLNGYFTVSSGNVGSFVSMSDMKFIIQEGWLYCYCNKLNTSNSGWIDFYASNMQIRSGCIFIPTLQC